MPSDALPDLGLLVLREQGPNASVVFDSFAFHEMGRVEPRLYCLTGRPVVGGVTYMATVDLEDPQYRQLLAALPLPLAAEVNHRFDGPFENPVFVTLPYDVSVALVAKLGRMQENDQERYVPFEALEVRGLAEESTKAADPALPVIGLDGNEEVVVLEVSPDIGKADSRLGTLGVASYLALDTLASGFTAAKGKKNRKWTAYIASKPHWSGLTFWVGLSASIPLPVIDAVQARLEALGTRVEREITNARRATMIPVAHVSDAGAFLLIPEGVPLPSSDRLALLLGAGGGRAELARVRLTP